MHEYSLVRSLLKQVESIRRNESADVVAEVCVEVGPLSGVEPLLVQSAFEMLKSGWRMPKAVLKIDEIPLSLHCQDCDCRYESVDITFRCGRCGGKVRVDRGDTFQLVSVSLRDSESEEVR